MRQASIKQAILLACVLVTVEVAAADSGPPERGHAASYSSIDSPPVTFIGKIIGELVRCSRDSVCEILHQATTRIYSLVVSGEFVYAGLGSGEILRCHINIKYSCNTFYKGKSPVLSLASGRGYLLAGLNDNTILRCEVHQPSCRTLYKVNGSSVYSLIQIYNSIIYAGLGGAQLMRCSLSIPNKCSEVHKANAAITGLASIGMSVYILTHVGELSKCSGATITDCVDSKVGSSSSWDIKAFNGSLYVQRSETGVCKLVNASCENFINIESSWSFAMAYGTNNLRNQYKDEHVTCEQSAQQCRHVTYYNEPERSAFEVYVKEGRLYNSTDSLVDTSDADPGHAGPAAIFVMAPDGKLYLSKDHQGATRTSSFLAGNPVSGAGEIVVERGVVRKILACSEHYEPTLELNAQVVHSLLAQGYTYAIVSETCPEVVERDVNQQVEADLQDVNQGPAEPNISELCPENTVNKTYTASDLEELDKKLQIIYTMQKSLDDLIKIYATEVNALKEKTDNHINPKQDNCKCSDVTNGQ